MRFNDHPFSGVEGDELYPEDEEAQRKIVAWVNRIYISSRAAKQPFQEKWREYYRMYRSWVEKRPQGEWRSRVWIPISFYVIETIMPRLVAQLPRINVYPVGPEDEKPAKSMETLLEWATDRSGLYLELTKALKSALLYGTGILKTFYDERIEYEIRRQPEMQPVFQEVPTGYADLDGNPITEQVEGGQVPTGNFTTVRVPYVSYQGPAAQAVDIDDFFVDPIADSVESARWVIHRVYRDLAHIEEMFERGIYKRPPRELWTSFIQRHAMLERQASVGLGGGFQETETRGLVPLLEVWTDDFVVVVAGEETGNVLLRAERNPYAHGEKPFIRVVDHLVPHEFWGIGELEPLEGIQRSINAIWNSRIDNVKMVLNTMFAAVMDYVVDISDLRSRPGGIIRVREGMPIDQVVRPIEFGEVTGSAYNELAEMERMSEKVSGVSPYQTGQDSPNYNRTATGIALISEQGNTRFSHKVKIAELTGIKKLAKHYGSILQQFLPPEMWIRILGPDGQISWQLVTAESIGGRFDYDIEAESITQTETVRKEQKMSLFQLLANDPYVDARKLRADILQTFGVKDTEGYLVPPQLLMQMGLYPGNEAMMMQMQAQPMMAPAPAPEEQAPAPEEQQEG
jgi:hypothetical protein